VSARERGQIWRVLYTCYRRATRGSVGKKAQSLVRRVAARPPSDDGFMDVARILEDGSTQWFCNRDDRPTGEARGGMAVSAAAYSSTGA
jgi:hypothetical protein